MVTEVQQLLIELGPTLVELGYLQSRKFDRTGVRNEAGVNDPVNECIPLISSLLR